MRFERRAVALLVAGAMALAGCGPAGPPVPAEVERLLEADFPADGQIHLIRSSGAFQIKPDTQFCTFSPGYGLNGSELADALKRMGQSDYWNGATRTNCATDDPNFSERLPELRTTAVFVKVAQSNDRHGEPYKLVLAVWQGDPANGGALWIGGVERLDGQLHHSPTVRLPIEPDEVPLRPEDLLAGSVKSDAYDLSNAFTHHIEGIRRGLSTR